MDHPEGAASAEVGRQMKAPSESPRADVLTPLRAALKSQYHGGLAMFREAVENCPHDLWLDDTRRNAFWQVAYHALFFTHLYLMPDEAAFRPWKGHQADVQSPDGIAWEADPNSKLPLLPKPYGKGEVLEYRSGLEGMIDSGVDSLDLESPGSGFPWYPNMPKLEHQIMNIRHLQHHTAQLVDRVRAAADVGTRWVRGRVRAQG